MKHATIAEFRNRLSRFLAAVKKGETIEILDRDLPVARVVAVQPPAPGSGKREEEAWGRRLEHAGMIRRGTGRSAPEILAGFPGKPKSSGVLDALLGERREGR